MLILFIMLVFGVIGGVVASNKGRSVAGWALLCALFPLIALIILVILPSGKSDAQLSLNGQGALPAGNQQALAARWENLSRYDPEIRGAVERLAPLGDMALAAFRRIFSDVGDKAAIPHIVEEIERGNPEAHLRMAGFQLVERLQGIPIYQDESRNYHVANIVTELLANARGMAKMTAQKSRHG